MINLLLWLFLLCTRGGDRMAIAVVYATLIVAGRRTFDQVPEVIRPAVKDALEALGLGTDGQPLKTA